MKRILVAFGLSLLVVFLSTILLIAIGLIDGQKPDMQDIMFCMAFYCIFKINWMDLEDFF